MSRQRVTNQFREQIEHSFALLRGAQFVFVAAVAWLFRFVQDDAFITYRFSSNMARGDGLVFNPGERVEGYTNFLWAALHVIPERLNWSTPLFSQLVGIGLLLATVEVFYRFALEIFDDRVRAWFATLVLCLNMTFVGYGTGGLETMLQTLLVLSIAYLVLTNLNEFRTGPFVGAGILGGLAVLVRLDSVLLVGGFFLAAMLVGWRRDKRPISQLVATAAACGLPVLVLVVPWLLWKLEYYGNVLPNTFYAKSTGNPLIPWGVALLYLALFVFSYFAFLLARRAWVLRSEVRGLKHFSIVAPIVALWLVYIVYVGADFMEFRFLVPVIPFLAIWCSVLVDSYVKVVPQLALSGALVLVSLAHMVFPNGIYPVLSFDELTHWPSSSEIDWKAMGDKLAEEFPGGIDAVGQPTIAVAPLGVISYYSDLPTVDMLGLSDVESARNCEQFSLYYPGHVRMAKVDYLISRHVALIIGQPSVEKRNTDRESYRLSEMVRFYPVANLNDLPDNAQVLEIPMTDEKVWRVIYLTSNEAVDQVIENEGWELFPIEHTCDADDLDWVDRLAADLTCPNL